MLSLLLVLLDYTSATGAQTRVARVRAECPDQPDYSGILMWFVYKRIEQLVHFSIKCEGET